MSDKSYTQNFCRCGHYYTSIESNNGNCPHCFSVSVFTNTVKVDAGIEFGVFDIADLESFILIPAEKASLGKIIYKIPLEIEIELYRKDRKINE